MSKKIYAKMIADAFPKALVRFYEDFDEYCYGWEIVPCPRMMIQLRATVNDEMYIMLDKYEMVTYNQTLLHKQIFRGRIPPNKDFEPDFDFIEGILRNYERF